MRAKTGDEEECARQQAAKGRGLLRPGCTGDNPDAGKPAFANPRFRQGVKAFSQFFKDRAAISGLKHLDIGRTRIAGADQHEQARCGGIRHLDERLQRIQPQEGVDGQRIRGETGIMTKKRRCISRRG